MATDRQLPAGPARPPGAIDAEADMDRETLDEARAAAAEAEYYAAVSALILDARALQIFVADHGGTPADALDFRRFLRTLRDDLDPADHRCVARAWLATCHLRGDAARERDELREFIRRASKAMGYARQPADTGSRT